MTDLINEKENASAFLADSADILGDVHLGADSSVWYQAVIRADEDRVEIGPQSNIQDGCILHTDAGFPIQIGKGVTIGHRAIIHGATIDDDVLIGMGAIVMNGAHIHSGSIVAAGALVLEGMEIPAGSLAAGVPAKILKPTSPAQQQMIRTSAQEYVVRAHESALRQKVLKGKE